MNPTILLYNHSGCENRGCEAIIRSTSEMFHRDHCRIILASRQKIYDESLKIPEIDKIIDSEISPYSLDRFINSIGFRLGISRESEVARKYAPVIRTGKKCSLCLSVGGDTYCYGRQEHMQVINRRLKSAGIPLVLWGCSIDPELLTSELVEELKAYDCIVARESLTAAALQNAGLNVAQKCDPAFFLKSIPPELPDGWKKDDTIGLNISPLVLDRMRDQEHALQPFAELIRHILRTTSCSIALFSHVTWKHDDDSEVNRRLSSCFKDEPRVFCLKDTMTAEEIKGYISRMKMVITARTHASIAAYSTFVPTLVIGYSVKSRGIARDIYGNEDTHVISASEISSAESLISAFDCLKERSEREHLFLKERIPEYCTDKENVYQKVCRLIK